MPSCYIPDGDEKQHIPALLLLSICTDEQSNSDKKSEKRVELGNVINKLNFPDVNVSDSDLISNLQLLFCCLNYKKVYDKASYCWMTQRQIFPFWISTQEHSLNRGMHLIDILSD